MLFPWSEKLVTSFGTFEFLLVLVLVILEILAFLSAIHAILRSKTSQGAIAWALWLVTCPLPFITLPIYWVLGRNRFEGYVKARRTGNNEIHTVAHQAGQVAEQAGLLAKTNDCDPVLERLALLPFLKHNKLELLIDGTDAFEAMFEAIAGASDYILVQFFIVKDDRLGREFQQALIKKAREGVRIYFIYDEIGSHKLLHVFSGRPRDYLKEMIAAGINVIPFKSNRNDESDWWSWLRSFPSWLIRRFQINFRNHRKIVVVDGEVAFTGGLNVGDEYVGRSKEFGPWRDTHVKLEGPAVHAVQLVFVEDWYWATGHKLPVVDWRPRAAPAGEQTVLVLPSGPADQLETCGMFFVHAINKAKRRLWIASPYFVPDSHVICALQLAALRGVDVRIVLPQNPDHLLVYLSSFSFLPEVCSVGVKLYRYQSGFMHHKVMLVDDNLAAVGSANLDNRSFRLNFELTIVSNDEIFAAEVEEMMAKDFEVCTLVEADEYSEKPLYFRIGVRLARLMAPIQ